MTQSTESQSGRTAGPEDTCGGVEGDTSVQVLTKEDNEMLAGGRTPEERRRAGGRAELRKLQEELS